jgi:membrane protein implicated in regulation of membrane protease activity
VGDLPHWALWLLAALVLLGAEAVTLQFVLVYFGLGAIVAAAVSPVTGPAGQGITFAVAAVVLMVLTRRPLVAWSQRQRGADTNVDTIAGRSAIVTIAIDNHANTGQIRVGSEYWTARTPGDEDPPIAPGTVVQIASVAGVTARVVPREAGGVVVIPKELQ